MKEEGTKRKETGRKNNRNRREKMYCVKNKKEDNKEREKKRSI